jgi:hypothetical protein
MKLKPWTIALLVLITLDAIVTTIIGQEENWMIVWVMKTIDINLSQAMFLKVALSLPVVLWLDRHEYTRITVIGYIAIYFILVGFQFTYA